MQLDMLVFGDRGYPVVLFPTSRGRFYQNKDFGLIDAAAWFVEQGLVRLYCPDSVDEASWYNKDVHPGIRIHNHIQYDRMLHEELVPAIMHETGQGRVAVAGCSFGGYHAANFAFRHPEQVSHMYSLSGAFDIRSELDGFYNEQAYFNNPVDFLPGARNGDLWRMKIILGTTDWDICKDANLHMSGILTTKGIDHWLDIRQGVHDWPVWREMFPHYLSLL
jgi:esterase/lipase superfamily enzyme